MAGVKAFDDALTVIAWYEKQTHQATDLTDNAIALELGWTRGGGQHGGTRRRKQEAQPYGDAGRVRSARRHVDHDHDWFKGYNFGSRLNGGGRSVSRLQSPNSFDEPGVKLHIGAQVLRAYQAVLQHEAELDTRVLPMMRDAAQLCETEGEHNLPLVLAMHDAVRDLQDRGRITQSTVYELIKAGISLNGR